MTFYSCAPSALLDKDLARHRDPSAGKATLTTSTLPVGTTYVEAVYGPRATTAARPPTWWPRWSTRSRPPRGLTSSPNPSNFGQSVTFTATVSAGSGTPGGTVTFYSCTPAPARPRPRSGPGRSASGKATSATSTLPVGHHLRRGRLRGLGQLLGSTSNVVAQVVNAALDHLGLTSSPNPSNFGALGDLHRHGLGRLGHAGRHGDLLQLHHQRPARRRPRSGPGPSASGKATLPTSTLPVGHHLRRGHLRGLGQLLGSTSNVVAQVVNERARRVRHGGYSDYITRQPAYPFLYGTNGNDFIYAFGASYWINGFAGQ